MQFRRQLAFGYAALLLVNLVTGAVAAIALRTSSTRLENVTRDLAADVFAIQQLRFQAEQLVSSSRGFLLTGDPRALDRFDAAGRRVTETVADLDRRRSDLADELARIAAAGQDYIAQARTAAHQREATGDPRDVVLFFERTLTPARDRFEQAMATFADHEREAVDRASRRALEFAERSQQVVFATTMLAIVLGFALATLSSRRLAAQYAQARAAIDAARRATAARDELVAIVSHDLRNPLATITMGAGLLTETEEDPRLRRHVAAIANAAGLMQHLIDQLLDVSKLEHGTLGLVLERVEVDGLLDALHSLFQTRAIEAQVALTVTGEPDTEVIGDRERALQVLSNLVANALKFTPRGGAIAVTGRRDGRSVRFEVTDTGPGVPEDQIPRLFERYYQGGSSPRGSLGLGLYICKQLVAAQRGEIGVRTALGAGSTFWFTLPVAAPARDIAERA